MMQTTSQFIQHTLRPAWRRLVHALEYRAGVLTGWRDPLIPPRTLRAVGSRGFVKVGEEFLRHFVGLGGLAPHERVLDVGCGTGRMAKPLTRYLKEGSYEGLDVVAPSIRWCQKVYAAHRNFRFQIADVRNRYYNPDGRCAASEYHFPFADSSFDFVFLTSVFTHMLPPDLENYLAEIARVLKNGGRCLITYFLLNPDASRFISEGVSRFPFRHHREGCRVDDDEAPEAAVGYDEGAIRALYARHRLPISEPIRYGAWCGRPGGLSWQDIVVAAKDVSGLSPTGAVLQTDEARLVHC